MTARFVLKTSSMLKPDLFSAPLKNPDILCARKLWYLLCPCPCPWSAPEATLNAKYPCAGCAFISISLYPPTLPACSCNISDYVVLQKPRDLTDCLPPPRTLILDFTLTHTRFGRSQLSSLGQLTHTRRTDGAPDPDGDLRTVTRAKIRHYRQLYINLPEPIAFIPVAVDTSDVSMTILVSYCFCTLTVKPQLWLMRYQRNQINLDFFGRLVMLILRDQWG